MGQAFLYTRIAATIASDKFLGRIKFNTDAREETDDVTYALGCDGAAFTLAPNGQSGYTRTVDLGPLPAALCLIVIVNCGAVSLTINGQAPLPVAAELDSRGGTVQGKFMITGTSITTLVITNTSAANNADVEVGFAG